MSKRRIFEVSPKGNDWTVKERGGRAVIAEFADKADAVKRAKQEAKKPFSQVVVRRKDGAIQTEYTYGRDPYPPVG